MRWPAAGASVAPDSEEVDAAEAETRKGTARLGAVRPRKSKRRNELDALVPFAWDAAGAPAGPAVLCDFAVVRGALLRCALTAPPPPPL